MRSGMFGLGLEGSRGRISDDSSARIGSLDTVRARKKTERPVRYKGVGETIELNGLGQGTITRVDPQTLDSSMKFHVSGKSGWEAEITVEEKGGEKHLVVDVTKPA